MLEAGWIKVFHPARRRASMRMTTGHWSSCGATSTSTAACARRAVTWSRCDPGRAASRGASRRCAGCASSGLPARPRGRAGWRARSCTRAVAAWRRRSARERSGFPARAAAPCRSSAAGASDPAVEPVVPRGRQVAAQAGPGPLRGHPAPEPRGPGAARRPGARHGRPAAPRGRRHPAVHARQRRPQHDLHPARHARASWATRARSGCTTRTVACHSAPATVLRRRIVEEFVPLRAPVHRGFDDWTGADVVLATGWDTAYAVGAAARTAAPAPTSSRTTSPSSSPPRPSRSGPRAPTSSACTGSPRAAGCATCSRAATDSAARWFRLGVDHGVYRPAPGRAPARHRDLLRPRVHAAARRAARARSRSRSCTGAARTRASCSSGRPRSSICPSTTSCSA